MAAALRSAPSASPPPPIATPTAELFDEIEVSSRLLMDEVLKEEFKKEEDIASAQAGINLAMSMEDIFGFPVEFPIPDVPDIQGEPALASEAD